MRPVWRTSLALVFLAASLPAQEMHDHGAPERLGEVSFPISCAPAVQQQFNRGIALLHSFAYSAAEQTFRGVAKVDPQCGMAHWGVGMTYFHQVWAPQYLPVATFPIGQREALEAKHLGAGSDRERQFIDALALLYQESPGMTTDARVAVYEPAMAELARKNSKDVEAQVFYALALLASAPPTDKTHAKQKLAIDVLEPLNREYPHHPGIAHYLIHACDSQELAQRGLPAARAYAQIAPSAPHALHMPSHIFTRLGLWDDSIQSNLASRQAAHQQGDAMGELHAMDYLVYAYLQKGQDTRASEVIESLREVPKPDMSNFGVAYAVVAMPVRLAVERGRWADAASIAAPTGTLPSVVAIAVWSNGLGLARTGHPVEARAEAERLRQIEAQLRASGDSYWAAQTGVLAREVMAWSAQASGDLKESLVLLRAAADQEDAMEKLPVTPGPILPAREQLGSLLLEQKQSELALKEFQAALVEAPGRRGALQGIAHASQRDTQANAVETGAVTASRTMN
jgi:tetratricopeptide (TPR) repeat protein